MQIMCWFITTTTYSCVCAFVVSSSVNHNFISIIFHEFQHTLQQLTTSPTRNQMHRHDGNAKLAETCSGNFFSKLGNCTYIATGCWQHRNMFQKFWKNCISKFVAKWCCYQRGTLENFYIAAQPHSFQYVTTVKVGLTVHRFDYLQCRYV